MQPIDVDSSHVVPGKSRSGPGSSLGQAGRQAYLSSELIEQVCSILRRMFAIIAFYAQSSSRLRQVCFDHAVDTLRFCLACRKTVKPLACTASNWGFGGSTPDKSGLAGTDAAPEFLLGSQQKLIERIGMDHHFNPCQFEMAW
jgi:hypothetical protein